MTVTSLVAPELVRDPAATNQFIQRWMQARIDEPREVMARQDDAARQLIFVSGLLQSAYVAVFTFGDLKRSVSPWLLLPLFASLLSVVYCAAKVLCTVLQDFNVHGALTLVRNAADGMDARLDAAVKHWCENVDRVATMKRRWLHYSNLSFTIASALTAILLTALAVMH